MNGNGEPAPTTSASIRKAPLNLALRNSAALKDTAEPVGAAVRRSDLPANRLDQTK